jgi:hypothetical protein
VSVELGIDSKNALKCPVRLAEETHKPGGNFLLLRSAYTTTILTVLGLLAGLAFGVVLLRFGSDPNKSILDHLQSVFTSNEIKAVFAFLGAISLSYWNMSNIFNRQWTYCADLYNKILQEGDDDARQSLKVSLAIDLLILDLWAHRSFRELFRDELFLAIDSHYSDSGNRKDLHRKANAGDLTENEANNLLEDRLRKLLAERHSSHSVEQKLADSQSRTNGKGKSVLTKEQKTA